MNISPNVYIMTLTEKNALESRAFARGVEKGKLEGAGGALTKLQQDNSGQAVIENGDIIIRAPIDALPQVAEGAWVIGALDKRWKVTDPAIFAKELLHALNNEDEQGTTMIHKMFDKAINEALEQGAEGIEEHETQDA
jgi:hypothetical protein